MSHANEVQHGGDHYGGTEYQHWDFVNDIRLPYIPATATKYAARWRCKGVPLLDLQKLDHYLIKCAEVGVQGSNDAKRHDKFWRFVRVNELDLHDAAIIFAIMEAQYERARELVKPLLDQTYTASRSDEIPPPPPPA